MKIQKINHSWHSRFEIYGGIVIETIRNLWESFVERLVETGFSVLAIFPSGASERRYKLGK